MGPNYYFFSGKGGVGKTTMAAAAGVYYAEEGRSTLLVTTDPASNLADIFEQEIGHKVTPVKGLPNLDVMELDPDAATAEYKEKTLAPLKGIIPEESLQILEEQLNSPCTAEMAAFDRFTDFLQVFDYEIIIFDTAPTGHTLRLLELPVEWSDVIEKAADKGGGQTCIGPAAALADSKRKYDQAVATMRNKDKTTFVFVLRPEVTPIYETKRAIAELLRLDINSQELIINGIYPRDVCDNPFFMSRYAKQQEYLKIVKNQFKVPIRLMELEDGEIKGRKMLSKTGKKLHLKPKFLSDCEPSVAAVSAARTVALDFPKIDEKIKALLVPKNNMKRTVFFAGKGGVGKTSVSAATALWSAQQGYKTLLLTTDPASHLGRIFEQDVSHEPGKVKGEENLWAARIDAEQATKSYKQRILQEASVKYDVDRVAAISEELNSPCTEEMAVFEKFIDYAFRRDFAVMIFDTAPTGHTLRLLELPVEWSKQLEIKAFTSTGETEVDKVTKSRFKEVISMMQDKDQTTFSFVMYPEYTPIEEAARAVNELAALGISTGLVVANLILPGAGIDNDYWRRRRAMQEKYLKIMGRRFPAPIVKLPLLVDELIGREKLRLAARLLYGV